MAYLEDPNTTLDLKLPIRVEKLLVPNNKTYRVTFPPGYGIVSVTAPYNGTLWIYGYRGYGASVHRWGKMCDGSHANMTVSFTSSYLEVSNHLGSAAEISYLDWSGFNYTPLAYTEVT